jgi:hypothetical protein
VLWVPQSTWELGADRLGPSRCRRIRFSLIPFGFERLVTFIRELRKCRQVLGPLIIRNMRGVYPEQLSTFADTHRSHHLLLT